MDEDRYWGCEEKDGYISCKNKNGDEVILYENRPTDGRVIRNIEAPHFISNVNIRPKEGKEIMIDTKTGKIKKVP